MAEGYGLVRVIPNSEIQHQEENKLKQEAEENEVVLINLASMVKSAWEVNRVSKEKIEDKLLDDLRARNGEYTPQKLTEIRRQGGSEIYMMLTSAKTRAATSWIRDILMNDQPWMLEPTPIPELPGWANEAIAKRIQETSPQPQDPQQAQQFDNQAMERAADMRDEVLKAMREIAQKANDNMEAQISDQLAQGGWEKAMLEFIDDFSTFSAAIMKGPVFRKRKVLKWTTNNSGRTVPKVTETIRMEFNRVSPFDAYPSPDADDPQDGNFIERILYSRPDLTALIGVPGYNDENIRKVLEDYAHGGLENWLWRDYERAQLENKENWWIRSDTNSIDGLHYWGTASGLFLLEWGMNPDLIPDPIQEYHVDVILIGNYVIRAVINDDPLGRRPYHKACYQTIPGGFWGISIPELMTPEQQMCNATARALANNLAIASGPMAEVDITRLADGEDPTQMYPWRVWQVSRDETGGNSKAINFFQPISNAAELLTVYSEFEKKADDSTNIPRYTYGNERIGGAGSTASGLSMLMNSAAKGIKLAIGNIDMGVTRPIIEMAYTFNMLYEKDPAIKGDVQVIAYGATAILSKEQSQMRRNEFLAMTNNPVDLEIIGPEGRAALLRESARQLDIPGNDVVPDKDEFMKRLAEKQQNQQPPPEILKLEADQKYNGAKLEAEAHQFNAKMTAQAEEHQREMELDFNKTRERLEMEKEIKKEMIASETERWQKQQNLERHKAAIAREKDLVKIREQMKLEREKANIAAKSQMGNDKETGNQPSGPINLTVIIDSKTGDITTEEIDFKRGKDKRISGMTITKEKKKETETGGNND